MEPRWKGKGFADIADANPILEIVTQLQGSLTQSKAYAMLFGCNVLLEAELELAYLLSKASFGRAIVTSSKDKQWFQLGPEEAFYLCHALKCLKVSRDETCMSEMELWDHFRSKREAFPEFYKAYFYLRSKNWVVRPGIQYGVDYVAYRHHPALVHSEYAVLVVSDSDDNTSSGRLRVWSDLHCTLRVCGSVAKTLLVLTVRRYGSDRNSLNCLEEFIVEEQTITRCVPERCREDQGLEITADMFLPNRSSLSGTSPNRIRSHTLFSMEPRWKGKGFADRAHANPMSEIVTQLLGSLTQSKTYAMLSGCDILLEAELELAYLLSKASFGQAIVTSNKDKQWFQLGPEEAFYLCHALKCLKVSRDKETCMSEMELWDHFRSKREAFPEFYKAYFYLRSKNWVVRSGIQYGVDYVAYRHHPALVHSEYAVLVVSDGDDNTSSGRLRVWSDLHCTLRVCGSVAKTLLVLTVRRHGSDRNSLNCLEEFIVEERTITRWVPERCREDQGLEEALGVD